MLEGIDKGGRKVYGNGVSSLRGSIVAFYDGKDMALTGHGLLLSLLRGGVLSTC